MHNKALDVWKKNSQNIKQKNVVMNFLSFNGPDGISSTALNVMSKIKTLKHVLCFVNIALLRVPTGKSTYLLKRTISGVQTFSGSIRSTSIPP